MQEINLNYDYYDFYLFFIIKITVQTKIRIIKP